MGTIRVYLAGPISGCNEDQKVLWRDEVRKRLGKDFEIEDPLEWADDRVITREIEKISSCDVVLANMWKESIGTTIGILRAIQSGKPVILVDPNHINNPILRSLIPGENIVDSVEKACTRVRDLQPLFKEFTVQKRDGDDVERFDSQKMALSIKKACAEAGVDDSVFVQRITGPAIWRARSLGVERGSITSKEIRDIIFDELDRMKTDPSIDAALKKKADDVVSAWRRKVETKDSENAIDRAKQEAEKAREDAEKWKRLYRDLARKLKEAPVAIAKEQEAPPVFTSVDQVINRIKREYRPYLFIHSKAIGGARKLRLKPKGLDVLYEMLKKLGEFMRERTYAEAGNERAPQFKEYFGNAYAPTESGETKKRYRNHPIVEYRGKKYFGLQHLKEEVDGKKLRIYFDEAHDGRLLISEICEHRETYGYNG